MIAVDTNILVYAHRSDSGFHDMALRSMVSLAEEQARWAIPWPCVHEFLAIVTHPRIYDPPSPQGRALESVNEWLRAPGCRTIAEGPGYFETLKRLVGPSQAVGGMVHDARVAAICIHHGVSVLWSADRDFSRFPALKTANPLL